MKNIYTKTKMVKNINDKRFQTNERKIWRELEHALTKRQLNLRAKDICDGAGISAPTFYLHCRNSDDALKNYEKVLITNFRQALTTKKPRREVIFLTLLHFVARNHNYFQATLVQHDAWLLMKILKSIRPQLATAQISDKCFDLYASKLESLIFCWGKYEHFNKQKMPLYAQKMLQTRIMDLGI